MPAVPLSDMTVHLRPEDNVAIATRDAVRARAVIPGREALGGCALLQRGLIVLLLVSRYGHTDDPLKWVALVKRSSRMSVSVL